MIKYIFIIFHLIDDQNNFIYNYNFKFKVAFLSKTNCIICVDNECLIIEQIKESLLSDILLNNRLIVHVDAVLWIMIR